MSMQAEVERLARVIEDLEAEQLATRYGVSNQLVLIAAGDQTVEGVIKQRLGHVPPALLKKIRVQAVFLPWLTGRKVALGGDDGIQTLEGEDIK